ncbi:hypothetical protein BU16DRAFT_288110 [Lophium mytilinum]|uniref:DUF6590 domain-containing protein n=1 Tax=Lophium mytilinum TaxID=390894 RepID=A0A6A6R3A3_9PEZI|nr:hypothetical protein BU16DRAFT_288110 [Lophium mytilinum]
MTKLKLLLRPIQTYSKRGVSALKTRSHHAIMYTGDDGPPDPLPQELPRTPSELPMGYPIRVIATEPWGKLDPLSRVNFRKVYTVEDNVKVYDFGIVARESMEKFLHQYNSAWGIAPTTPTSTAKHSTPGPPEHSGADLSKTNNAATTAPHDNSWIWSEEHQRHYRIIYDKNGNPVYIWQEVTPAYSRTASPGTDERKRKIFRWMTTIPQSSPPPLTITTSSSK